MKAKALQMQIEMQTVQTLAEIDPCLTGLMVQPAAGGAAQEELNKEMDVGAR